MEGKHPKWDEVRFLKIETSFYEFEFPIEFLEEQVLDVQVFSRRVVFTDVLVFLSQLLFQIGGTQIDFKDLADTKN